MLSMETSASASPVSITTSPPVLSSALLSPVSESTSTSLSMFASFSCVTTVELSRSRSISLSESDPFPVIQALSVPPSPFPPTFAEFALAAVPTFTFVEASPVLMDTFPPVLSSASLSPVSESTSTLLSTLALFI